MHELAGMSGQGEGTRRHCRTVLVGVVVLHGGGYTGELQRGGGRELGLRNGHEGMGIRS